MNLTIVKELLSLYKNDPNTQIYINESKLLTVCDKIKLKTQSESKNSRVNGTKLNNSQLASACWNLLVQINRNVSSSFSTPVTFLQTSKVVLSCAKVIESAQGDFKMGPLDLEKMVANLIAKLSEGLKITLNSSEEETFHIINLMEFFFERLQKHFNSLEIGIRRMSLAEIPSAHDPFVDVNFHGIFPESTKDTTLKQLAVVALESLCRIILIFQNGPIDKILDVLKPFHVNTSSDTQIAHFISSVCKLEFWSPLEWKFWNWISCYEIYNQHLIYFKKRCHLKLSPPTFCDKLNMKIIATVLTNEQLIEEMLDMVRNDEYFDELIGPCLELLMKEENRVYTKRIEALLKLITSSSFSETALRSLLYSLDSLRNGLFHLVRDDMFICLLDALNEFLLRINFPVKFYVSWTSQVLKSIVESRNQAPQVKDLVKKSIKGLLECENIPDDMRCKVQKIVSQTLSIAADCELLKQFINSNSEYLGSVLEASNLNLSQDYFNELTRSVFSANSSESVFISWIKVLSSQVNVSAKAFEYEDVRKLNLAAKLISYQVFDQIKQAQYLELIYSQMLKLGLHYKFIVLSKQILAFKNPKLFYSFFQYYNFANRALNSAVQAVKLYHETEKLVISTCDFTDLKIDNDIEREFYFYFLNLVLVKSSKDDFKNTLLRFEKFDGLNGRMMHLLQLIENSDAHDCDSWENVINTKLSELNTLYKKVTRVFKILSPLIIIRFLGKF